MALFHTQKFAPKRHLNYLRGSYLESTSRPLYALLFLLPWVAVYEMGTILVNTDQIAHTQSRVAAFTWIMGIAEWAGIGQNAAWAFPGIVIAIILLVWHIVSRHPWHVRWRWLAGMALESLCLTLPLFVLGALMNTSNNFSAGAGNGGAAIPHSGYLANAVTSIGAGIYEELVFRLILMGLLIMLLEDVMKLNITASLIISVFLSAGLFAAHHYIGIESGVIARLQNEPFTAGSFIFRTVAGLYFAAVFWYRGYGITAGAHAVYNLIYFSLKADW